MSKEAMKLALQTAEGIANANWREWHELASPDEFERWVKSRANHMAIALREALAEQPAQQEPVAVHQFRNRYVTDWYDGAPDHQDGHGPYEVRTLYTAPPKEKNT